LLSDKQITQEMEKEKENEEISAEKAHTNTLKLI
jgi:hypothetical protein